MQSTFIEAEEHAIATPTPRTVILSALKGAGIARLTIPYDGYGDEGNIDEDWEVLPEGVALPDGATTLPSLVDGAPVEGSLKKALADIVLEILGQHDGWEDNEGSVGEVVFDVEAGTIEHLHRVRVTAYEDSSFAY